MSGGPSKALELNAENVRDLFRYEPDSGKLFWKKRDAKYFKDGGHTAEHKAAAWNAKFAGLEITYRDRNGYIRLALLGSSVAAHRVIWLLVNGRWPDGFIDHVNGVKSDNRLCNLRDVTHQDNMRNQRRRKDNLTGTMGVCWHKQNGKWWARITVNGRDRSLGLFDNLEAAIAARKAAEVEFGFHENHGRA